MTHNEYMRNYHHQKPHGANPATSVCKVCSQPFQHKPWIAAKYCSRQCEMASMSKKISLLCQACGKSFVVKKYRENTAKACSQSCAMRLRKGPLSPAWKGGKVSERESWQGSLACKEWRKAVFIRDNFACVLCGASADDGVRLQADHIKPWAYFPELRDDVDNGRTLCIPCHMDTDTWGSKAKKLEYAI